MDPIKMNDAEFAAHAEKVKAQALAMFSNALSQPLPKVLRRIAEESVQTLNANTKAQ